MKRNLFLMVVICGVLFVVSRENSHAQVTSTGKQIVMACQFDPKDNPVGKFLKKIYTEAFKRLGYNMVYKFYPMERVSIQADEGDVDGELARVKSYAKLHPNLIRVDEPAISSKFVAYATNPEIRLKGWESLRGTNYKIDLRRGAKQSKSNLSKLGLKSNLYFIDSSKAGLKRLLAGRADIFIELEDRTAKLLRSEEFRMIRNVGVMEEVTGHAYFHRKNQELAPKLSAVLKKMKKEGLLLRNQ